MLSTRRTLYLVDEYSKERTLPLDEYWDEDTWRWYYIRSCKRCKGLERQALLRTMRSLGLNVIPLSSMGIRNLDKRSFVTLDNDINMAATTLSEQFSANELVRHAANSNYLDEEIDALLQEHSSIWSMGSDRSQLLVPGVDENYPKHLFYEENEDQKMYIFVLRVTFMVITNLCCRLWMHLHRWIVIMALRKCRRMWGPEVKNMGKKLRTKNTETPATDYEDMLGEFQLEGTYTFDVPEDSSRSPTRSTGSNSTIESSTDSDTETVLFKRISNYLESSVIGEDQTCRQKRAASKCRHNVWEGDNQVPKKRKRDRHSTTIPTDSTELSILFKRYLELYDDPQFDELTALNNLAREASLLERCTTVLHTQKGVKFATAFFVDSFPAWLVYRGEIVNAKRKYAGMRSSEKRAHHQLYLVERSRLAAKLRQAHERFMKAGHEDLRPEQVILQAFITFEDLPRGHQIAEAMRKGFKGMEDELRLLGDQLMNEGGRWILGLGSVTNARGMSLNLGPARTKVGRDLYH